MYLHHVKRRLEEETARIDFYLDYTTRPQLIKIVEKCLIADHLDVLIEKGEWELRYSFMSLFLLRKSDCSLQLCSKLLLGIYFNKITSVFVSH